jgi:hypothetical protein
MTFSLIPLLFECEDFDGLIAPVMRWHRETVHAQYMAAMNALLARLPQFSEKSVEEILSTRSILRRTNGRHRGQCAGLIRSQAQFNARWSQRFRMGLAAPRNPTQRWDSEDRSPSRPDGSAVNDPKWTFAVPQHFSMIGGSNGHCSISVLNSVVEHYRFGGDSRWRR